MNDYIQLSTLNDFIFCPYSIYLHSVYMESDGDLYKAAPQTKGTLAHQGVDEKKGSTRKSDMMSLPVYCDELGISGKIDVYKHTEIACVVATSARDEIGKLNRVASEAENVGVLYYIQSVDKQIVQPFAGQYQRGLVHFIRSLPEYSRDYGISD